MLFLWCQNVGGKGRLGLGKQRTQLESGKDNGLGLKSSLETSFYKFHGCSWQFSLNLGIPS